MVQALAPRTPTLIYAGTGLLSLMVFYLLVLDQGLLLSLVQGNTAYQANFIHELLHDARHAAGFPCH